MNSRLGPHRYAKRPQHRLSRALPAFGQGPGVCDTFLDLGLDVAKPLELLVQIVYLPGYRLDFADRCPSVLSRELDDRIDLRRLIFLAQIRLLLP